MLKVSDLISRGGYSREDFVFFWGHKDRANGLGKHCLSQWYQAPMVIDGVYYNCMEQYMMAEKARLFNDAETESRIMAEYSQMAIKKLGRQVVGYVDAQWKAVRQQVSVKGNIAKFSQNKALGEFLLSTGNKIIVEASPKDTIWGIGLAEDSAEAIDPRKWRGENILGFALMAVREILRSVDSIL